MQSTHRPLTRRALLTEAFRFLDSPYGWGGGGSDGGHDCSSFVMEVFGSFGVRLPRHSAWQARAGTFSVDVSKVAVESERLQLIEAAARKGVVLLSFPGHVMLYLGRSESGAPMVLHAIAEYAEACPGGGETLHQIDGISVSDLNLGRGSSRKSLFERITTVTVIGKPPASSSRAPPRCGPPHPCRNRRQRAAIHRTSRSSPRHAFRTRSSRYA